MTSGVAASEQHMNSARKQEPGESALRRGNREQSRERPPAQIAFARASSTTMPSPDTSQEHERGRGRGDGL